MSSFQVPQFIETEDKIVGPLTIRQFLYLAVGGALSGVCYLIFQPFLAIVMTLIFMGIGGILAFVKINGRTMPTFLVSAFSFIWNRKLYIFSIQKDDGSKLTKKEKLLSDSHKEASGLREIGEQIATSRCAVAKREAALPPGTTPNKKEIEERYEIVRELSGAKETARRIAYR